MNLNTRELVKQTTIDPVNLLLLSTLDVCCKQLVEYKEVKLCMNMAYQGSSKHQFSI